MLNRVQFNKSRLSELELQQLQASALKVRKIILNLSKNGGCFTGASLSCADLLVYLYFKKLNININNLNDSNRDYLFLSKGHDVPALYATFCELGILDEDRLLNNHLKTNDYIYWHPNTRIQGIEFHSGSLGHLISVAAGVAYDCKNCNQDNSVYVILGDGELNEGSVWEALLVASAYCLDNLIIIIDRNNFQANIQTEELIPLEPLIDKFISFNLNVKIVNGHNFDDLHYAFLNLPVKNSRPSVVIANTIRGKGVPSIENKADRWFCNFTEEEVESLTNELCGGNLTNLKSNSLIVR
jgi:transketolase